MIFYIYGVFHKLLVKRLHIFSEMCYFLFDEVINFSYIFIIYFHRVHWHFWSNLWKITSRGKQWHMFNPENEKHIINFIKTFFIFWLDGLCLLSCSQRHTCLWICCWQASNWARLFKMPRWKICRIFAIFHFDDFRVCQILYIWIHADCYFNFFCGPFYWWKN